MKVPVRHSDGVRVEVGDACPHGVEIRFVVLGALSGVHAKQVVEGVAARLVFL
jgi:hypothetical protein